MAMGVVSSSDFDKEFTSLNSPKISIPSDNSTQAIIQDIPPHGRGAGNVEVPSSLRKVIAEESVVNGRENALKLAGEFGISPSSVSAYKNGTTSTASYDTPRVGLTEHVNGVKERIGKKARGKLMLALRHITAEKLDTAKVSEIAAVAKDMSAIVKNMEPDTPKIETNKSGPTFVFYAPVTKSEMAFDVIDVKE